MAAVSTSRVASARGKQRRVTPATAGGAGSRGSFAALWTSAFLALLDELRAGTDDFLSLEGMARILVRHGARLVDGAQCVINVVTPERPEYFTVLAGEGEWAAGLVGESWPVEGTINGRAMLAGTPVETTRPKSESATPDVFDRGPIGAGRVVPLRLQTPLADGRLAMGSIGFWRTGRAPFTSQQRLLLDTYGELASVLLHRSELLLAATRTAHRLETAVDLAVTAGASLVPTSVMRGLLERSLEAVRADRASFCRISGTSMTVLDVVDRLGQAAGTGDRHEQPWHPAVERAVHERMPVVIGPFADGELLPAIRHGARGAQRTLFVPLIAEGDVIALLTFIRRSDDPFTEADVSTVQLIGNIASLSLRNAERFAESERAHTRSLSALVEITAHVDDTYESEEFFGRLSRTVADLVGARRAAFFQVDAAGTSSLIKTAFNIPPSVASRAERRRLRRDSPAWTVAFEDQTFRSTDAGAAAHWLPRLKAGSTMAASWRAGDRVLGSLVALDAANPEGFTEEDAWVLRIAALASGLISQHKQVQAREYQLAREARERVHEIAVVQDAAEALSTAIDIGDVFRQVVQSAAHIVTPTALADRRATLLRVDDNRAIVMAEYDESGMRSRVTEFDLDEHPQLRRVAETGDVVVIDTGTQDVAAPTARQMETMAVRSSALAPVRVDEKVVAILRVSARDETGFGPAHLERLRAIANVAALAVGNAERYQLAQREALRRAELENVKSDFLRLASHELRAPIGLLRGYLSMFEDGTVPAVSGKARETLPLLLDKVAQMSHMVDDMLETARLEEGSPQVHLEVTDLRDTVLRAVQTIVPFATAAHTVRPRVPESPVLVAIDRGSVETILTNLLDNAIKYSPSGGPIECTLKVGAGSASVAVRDRGLGIAEGDLPRLFTRFGRILTPENSHISGTGLGLHLAQELARRQNGTISVRSQLDRGSVFTLRLPLSTD